jgi:hypothetical protein
MHWPWFETRGLAALLTMRLQDLILRSIAQRCVSKDDAANRKSNPGLYLNSGVPGTKASNAAQNCAR